MSRNCTPRCGAYSRARTPHARQVRGPRADGQGAQVDLVCARSAQVSDPDLNLPNHIHAFQTAEGLRAQGMPDWLQLTGLIDDCGKMIIMRGCDEDGTSMASQCIRSGPLWSTRGWSAEPCSGPLWATRGWSAEPCPTRSCSPSSAARAQTRAVPSAVPSWASTRKAAVPTTCRAPLAMTNTCMRCCGRRRTCHSQGGTLHHEVSAHPHWGCRWPHSSHLAGSHLAGSHLAGSHLIWPDLIWADLIWADRISDLGGSHLIWPVLDAGPRRRWQLPLTLPLTRCGLLRAPRERVRPRDQRLDEA